MSGAFLTAAVLSSRAEITRAKAIDELIPRGVAASGGVTAAELSAALAEKDAALAECTAALRAEKDAEIAALQAENAALRGLPPGGPRPPPQKKD